MQYERATSITKANKDDRYELFTSGIIVLQFFHNLPHHIFKNTDHENMSPLSMSLLTLPSMQTSYKYSPLYTITTL